MAKTGKRKKTFADRARAAMRSLDELLYDDEADYDAVERAKRELATAAGMRKRAHRRKSLQQTIADAQEKLRKKELLDAAEEERRAKKRAADKRRRARQKKAEEAGKE